MAQTIAAIATGAVKSAIGIIRMSGDDVRRIISEVFHPKYGSIKPRRMTFGYFYDAEGVRVDEGLCVFMPAPGSYTGEDTAEFYCHGSLGVLNCVLDAVLRAGARPARPGEFTRRAFLSGRMDLTQAEAVIDLIDSESREAARTAAAQFDGAIGGKIKTVRESLVALTAHLCAVVDYPEDDIPELLMEDALETVKMGRDGVKALLGTYERGALIKNGIPCAIVGKPNVGKSSLLNALAGYDRSIVTEIAGTTRDMVEETVSIGGMTFRMQDTAGLRETDDVVERIGVERACGYAKNARLVLAVFDGSRELDSHDEMTIDMTRGQDAICVVNQADKEQRIDMDSLRTKYDVILTLSAKSGEGLEALTKTIADRFTDKTDYSSGIVTNPRHVDALRRCEASLDAVSDGIRFGMTADVITVDLEAAIDALGELTGQTASEDVMNGIFSRFCVGK